MHSKRQEGAVTMSSALLSINICLTIDGSDTDQTFGLSLSVNWDEFGLILFLIQRWFSIFVCKANKQTCIGNKKFSAYAISYMPLSHALRCFRIDYLHIGRSLAFANIGRAK